MLIPIITSYKCLIECYIFISPLILHLLYSNFNFCLTIWTICIITFLFFYFICYYNLLFGIYNNYFNNRGMYVTLVIFQPVYCTFNHPLTIFFLTTSPLFYVCDYSVIFRYQPMDEYLLRVTNNFSVITYFIDDFFFC